VPLGVEVTGANRPDMEVVEATLGSIPVDRPEPTADAPQHRCGDKGYDAATVRELVAGWGYTATAATVDKERGSRTRENRGRFARPRGLLGHGPERLWRECRLPFPWRPRHNTRYHNGLAPGIHPGQLCQQ
jgi:hypothetical protein